MRESEPPFPDRGPAPLPPPLQGDPPLDPCVDDDILTQNVLKSY